MRAFCGVLRRCCRRNAGHFEHKSPLTSTCNSFSPSWRTLLTSAYVHAIGDSTRSSSLDLFDRHGLFACAILAAKCWVRTSVYSSNQPILLTSRQLKKAHRDRAAGLQTVEDPLLVAVSEALLDRLEDCNRTFQTVAVLGGAGDVVTSRLGNGRAGIEKVLQMDLSSAMLQKSQTRMQASAQQHGQKQLEVHYLEGDEEFLPFKPGSLDLIVSCLSCHWVNDLPGMLQQCRRALKPDGLFLASMFGGDTLHELRVSLNLAEEELQGGVSQRVSPLAQVRDCGSLLTVGGFNIPAVDVDDITIHYKDFKGIVSHLRSLGESNAVQTRQPVMHRAVAERAEAIYRERFEDKESGTLPVTFQVLYMTGWAPHASQQKPARRGSATVSFEDLQEALGKQADTAGKEKD